MSEWGWLNAIYTLADHNKREVDYILESNHIEILNILAHKVKSNKIQELKNKLK